MFFTRTSKILMRLNAVFFVCEGLQLQNALIMFLFSMYLLTVKTTQDVNNSFRFLRYERATVGNSLRVKSNFWCLIMPQLR